MQNPELIWEDYRPHSQIYQDSYFSHENGLEESRFVFLRGNQLQKRLGNSQTAKKFKLCETGFGTGLNILALAQELKRVSGQLGPCEVFSVEKHPLDIESIARAHRPWPELHELSSELQANWPQAQPGWHRIELLGGALQVQLFHGDVSEWCRELQAKQVSPDAWFLDGFSPAQNPSMWCPELFKTMAQTAQSGTSFATFTAAGFVRRSLQNHGFEVSRVPGYGKKREMLTGYWP